MSSFEQLLAGMIAGRNWDLMGNNEKVRELAWLVFEE